MRLITITCLVDAGGFTRTPVWERISSDLRKAIEAIHWPSDSSIFTIHPQSGKKRGQGNGVKPIKEAFVLKLLDLGWKPEQGYPRGEDDKEADPELLFPCALPVSKLGLKLRAYDGS